MKPRNISQEWNYARDLEGNMSIHWCITLLQTSSRVEWSKFPTSLIEKVNKKAWIKATMKLAQHLRLFWASHMLLESHDWCFASVRGKFCRSWSLTAVEHKDRSHGEVGSQRRRLGADYWSPVSSTSSEVQRQKWRPEWTRPEPGWRWCERCPIRMIPLL